MRDNPFEQAGMIVICTTIGLIFMVHIVERLI
jgi:hypothetical protein